MKELTFDEDLYQDNGELVYSHDGLGINQIWKHYAYMEDFFPKHRAELQLTLAVVLENTHITC